MEREDAAGVEIVHCPLLLLHYLGDPETAELVVAARRLCRRGDSLDGELSDIELGLRGEEDVSAEARQYLADDWRAAARSLGSFYGPDARAEK